MEFSRKSLVGKAKARPDLVRRVITKARTDGAIAAYTAARNRLDDPMAVGYSSAGKALASDVPGCEPGQLVAAAGAGFATHAEVAWIPANLCAPVPAGVSAEKASFATLGAIALHGIHRAGIEPGMRVGVLGLGLLGNLTAQILRAYRCPVVGMDLHPTARKGVQAIPGTLVARVGKDATKTVDDMTGGAGLDAVIITAASKEAGPVDDAGALCREGGTVCVLGDVPLAGSRRLFYERELNLVVSRSYGFGRHDQSYELDGVDYPMAHARWTIKRNLEEVLRLMAEGALDPMPLIRDRYPIDRAPEAYEELLKGGGAGGAFLLTYDGTETHDGHTVQVPVASPAAKEGVGVAAIGAGSFARGILFPRLAKLDGWTPISVASANGLHARQAATKFGFPEATSDAKAVLEDERVGLVIITTRHNHHAPMTAQALRSGKDVFVEKPLALDIEGLHDVAHALRTSNRRLHVGFNRRFAPMVQQIKAHLGSSKPRSIHLRIRADAIPPDHWLRDPVEGGGRILGEVCHFVDLAQDLAGAEPVQVSAFGGANGVPAEDHLAAMIRFANGSQATITYAEAGGEGMGKEWLEVLAGDKSATMDNYRRLRLIDGTKQRTTTSRQQDKGHSRQLELLLEAIKEGTSAPVPPSDLLASTLATLAIPEALSTGRPVRLDMENLAIQEGGS